MTLLTDKEKAEKMHGALVRFADVEKYHHGNDGVYDAVFDYLREAPEESKVRLHDLLTGEAS